MADEERPQVQDEAPDVQAPGADRAQLEGRVLELLERVRNLEGQSGFLVQQGSYVLQALGQQSAVLQESQNLLRAELKRFQTGGPQRAMASIFLKLFRDLLEVMNQLDDLVSGIDARETTEQEQPWIRALTVLRGQMEFTLAEWGCTPMGVEAFVTQFDPDLHEAVPYDEETPTHDPAGRPVADGVIVKVVQRGWTMQQTILQYPRVVVR